MGIFAFSATNIYDFNSDNLNPVPIQSVSTAQSSHSINTLRSILTSDPPSVLHHVSPRCAAIFPSDQHNQHIQLQILNLDHNHQEPGPRPRRPVRPRSTRHFTLFSVPFNFHNQLCTPSRNPPSQLDRHARSDPHEPPAPQLRPRRTPPSWDGAQDGPRRRFFSPERSRCAQSTARGPPHRKRRPHQLGGYL